jgi:hypothetical protein
MPPKKNNNNNKKKKRSGKGKTDNSPIVPQPESPLLRLPGELREQIYDFLFVSTRVTFGERSTGRIGRRTLKPAPHSLALLRVCRQIYKECKYFWLSRVLFNFESVESLLDKLSPLPLATLSQIRHVRTRGDTLMLSPPDADDDVYYRLVWALKLLPGLQLDTLTVLGQTQGPLDYETLEGLIEHGDGWRELRYITSDSTMLGFEKHSMFMANPYWRRPQPTTWNDILLKRDDVDSKPTVAIYRSTQSKNPGTVMNKATRQIVDQMILPPSDLEAFGVEEDPQFVGRGEKEKELLVVVKRSRGADILQHDVPPFSAYDIRQWAEGMTWQEIKKVAIDFLYDKEEDHYLDSEDEDDTNVEVDKYNDVDEYVWDDTVWW